MSISSLDTASDDAVVFHDVTPDFQGAVYVVGEQEADDVAMPEATADDMAELRNTFVARWERAAKVRSRIPEEALPSEDELVAFIRGSA